MAFTDSRAKRPTQRQVGEALDALPWMPSLEQALSSRATPMVHLMEFNMVGGQRWARLTRADQVAEIDSPSRSLRQAMDWLLRIDCACQDLGWTQKDKIGAAWVAAVDLCRDAASAPMKLGPLDYGSAVPVDWSGKVRGLGRPARIGAAIDFREVRIPKDLLAGNDAFKKLRAHIDSTLGQADWFDVSEIKGNVRIEDCEGPAQWLASLRESLDMERAISPVQSADASSTKFRI